MIVFEHLYAIQRNRQSLKRLTFTNIKRKINTQELKQKLIIIDKNATTLSNNDETAGKPENTIPKQMNNNKKKLSQVVIKMSFYNSQKPCNPLKTLTQISSPTTRLKIDINTRGTNEQSRSVL